MDILRIIFAIILPPLRSFLRAANGKHCWIDIILTLPCCIPRIVHAVHSIARR